MDNQSIRLTGFTGLTGTSLIAGGILLHNTTNDIFLISLSVVAGIAGVIVFCSFIVTRLLKRLL